MVSNRPPSKILDGIIPSVREVPMDKRKMLREEAKTIRQANAGIRADIKAVAADMKPLNKRDRELRRELARNVTRLEKIKALLAV